MDLRQLRYFVAVAETQNIAQAAEALHISQSPLSRQILQLESELGLELFERAKQRIRLNPQGRILLEEAQDLLAQAARVRAQAESLASGRSGRLTIGYVDGAMHSGLLSSLLRRFQKRYPDMRLELVAMRSGPQAEALLRGAIDVGFVYTPTQAQPQLATHRLLSENTRLAVPRDHRLARTRRITPADLDGQPWIALPRSQSPVWRERFLATCRKSGFTPDIRYETVLLSTVLGLVDAGLALSFVQESARRASPPGVIYRSVPWFAAKVEVHLSWRREPERLLARRFVDALLTPSARGREGRA